MIITHIYIVTRKAIISLYNIYLLLSFRFIEPQILNFEKGLSLSMGSQSSRVPPCKTSLGGPGGDHVQLLPGRPGHYRLYNSEWVSDSCSAIVQLYYGDCIIVNNVKLMWTFLQYHYICF